MEEKYTKCYQLVSANTQDDDKRYKDLRRDWNYCAKNLKLNPQPLHVDIEITNACNLKCRMCERQFMTRKIGYMDYDFFCKIIDQCVESGILSVKLNLWGESFLHKDLFKMIKYAKKNDIFCQFNTNVTFLNKENAKKLIDSGLDRITFSIESIRKELYEDTRRGANYEKMMENLESFINSKPVGKKPYLTLQMIRMKKNHKYIQEFIDRYKERVDFISVTNVGAGCGDPEILKESLIDYKAFPKIPCSELWLRLSIFWNGDVTACCHDYDGFLKIGNLKESSLKDLWNSKKLQELRERHRKLDFSGLLCYNCTANYKLS